MNATTTASRAILAAYAKTVLRPVEIIAAIIFALALFGTAYLIVAFSAWWWLLMIPVILYGLLGSVLWLVLHYTLDRITPEQTSEQRQAVAEFVNISGKVAESLKISQFTLLLRVIQDVMYKKQENIIAEFTKDSANLKQAFENVVKAFR